jgi:hypothetical protein
MQGKAKRFELIQAFGLKRWQFDKGLKAMKQGYLPGTKGRRPKLTFLEEENIMATIRINSACQEGTSKKEIKRMVCLF